MLKRQKKHIDKEQGKTKHEGIWQTEFVPMSLYVPIMTNHRYLALFFDIFFFYINKMFVHYHSLILLSFLTIHEQTFLLKRNLIVGIISQTCEYRSAFKTVSARRATERTPPERERSPARQRALATQADTIQYDDRTNNF